MELKVHTYEELVEINRGLKTEIKKLKKRCFNLKGGNIENKYGTVGNLKKLLSNIPNQLTIKSLMIYTWYSGKDSKYEGDFENHVKRDTKNVYLEFGLPCEISSSLSNEDYDEYRW